MPVCWCPPRCGAPLRAPRGVVCCVPPPCGGRVPRMLPPPCGGFLPRVLVPPRGVVAPTETFAMTAERLHSAARCIRSLARWRHQGSGHPHAYYGSCEPTMLTQGGRASRAAIDVGGSKTNTTTAHLLGPAVE